MTRGVGFRIKRWTEPRDLLVRLRVNESERAHMITVGDRFGVADLSDTLRLGLAALEWMAARPEPDLSQFMAWLEKE
ncbi:hypothetical protein [Brevundimonas sp. VNH65]|uniref:hypothetical protein n=1 Tax=Brevundimonas sp. VNH65 TaxID=3400917 RepID=UPI003C2FFB91